MISTVNLLEWKGCYMFNVYTNLFAGLIVLPESTINERIHVRLGG